MGAAVPADDLPSSIVPDNDLPSGPTPRVGWAEENLAGPSEIIGSTVANIPHAAAHAAVDLWRRVTGGNTDAPDPAAIQALQVPLGQGGQQLLGDIGSMASPVTAPIKQGLSAADTAIGNVSPTLQDVIHQTGQVVGDVANLAPVAGLVKGGVSAAADALAAKPTTAEAAQAVVNKVAATSNAGAAGTSIDASKLTPDTQETLAKVKPEDVNATALARHADAETLPVPVQLTAGQARGDAAMISDEFNRKGLENNAIGNLYNQQDQALQDNLSTIHREIAPTTVGNDDIQNGQVVIDSLKRYDRAQR